jgi:hypothetical protein
MSDPENQAVLTPGQRTRQVLLFPLNVIASGLDLVFCLPWIGRILKFVWNFSLTAVHFIFGMIEFIAWNFGFRPMKKLKVGVLLLSGETGRPIDDPKQVGETLIDAVNIYRDSARIKLVPACHIPKALARDGQPDEHWVRVISYEHSKQLLKLGCDCQAFKDDLSFKGMRLQHSILQSFFFTAARRVFGYGSPVTVVITKEIIGKLGCSLGCLTDYVTVQLREYSCIPHEIGHALGLFHRKDPENLLYAFRGRGNELTPWQIAVIRSSRHVTFI